MKNRSDYRCHQCWHFYFMKKSREPGPDGIYIPIGVCGKDVGKALFYGDAKACDAFRKGKGLK